MSIDEAGDDGGGQLFPVQKSTKNAAAVTAAETQIVSNIRDVRYIVREYRLFADLCG
jgi:hypothetical protein